MNALEHSTFLTMGEASFCPCLLFLLVLETGDIDIHLYLGICYIINIMEYNKN